MAARFSAQCAGRPLPPGRFVVLISVKRLSRPQGHSGAGRIRSIAKSDYYIGNRTRGLPGYSMVPLPTTLPRAPRIKILMFTSYAAILGKCFISSILCNRQTQQLDVSS
jgi:hypothetical protein